MNSQSTLWLILNVKTSKSDTSSASFKKTVQEIVNDEKNDTQVSDNLRELAQGIIDNKSEVKYKA